MRVSPLKADLGLRLTGGETWQYRLGTTTSDTKRFHKRGVSQSRRDGAHILTINTSISTWDMTLSVQAEIGIVVYCASWDFNRENCAHQWSRGHYLYGVTRHGWQIFHVPSMDPAESSWDTGVCRVDWSLQ